MFIALLTACWQAPRPPTSAAPAQETRTEDPTEATPTPKTLEGVDVSHYQGEVDWTAVRSANIDFAYAKATQGASEIDPTFHANWTAMKTAGVARGAYHFYVAGDAPEAQASHFLAQIELGTGDLLPMVDVETGDVLPSELHTFLQALEAELGVRPILYTNHAYWTSHLDDSFSEYPLWIAQYDGDPHLPIGWIDWSLWQYEPNGTVEGIDGNVDRDRMRGPLSRFQVP